MPDSPFTDQLLGRALDQVRRRVLFSNPVPEWYESSEITHSTRIRALRDQIARYLAGATPKRPFKILVPRPSGMKKPWLVPTYNDQVIIHACVLALAEKLDAQVVQRDHVYSYRYHADDFVEDQLAAWLSFRSRTAQLPPDSQLLQIDLELVSERTDLVKLAAFLRRVSPGGAEIDLLERLLRSLDPTIPGLPFVNDSLFFLLNAYLSVVDELVGRHTQAYFRFVDDYRISDGSRERLEALVSDVNAGLRPLGFRINPAKTYLGTVTEYLEAVSKARVVQAQEPGLREGYFVPLPVKLVDPAELVRLIERTLGDPDDLLNDGFGRSQLAAVRRMRIDALLARPGQVTPGDVFARELSKNTKVISRAIELLNAYAPQASEAWRSVWLLYVLKDAAPTDQKLARDLRDALAAVNRSQRVPEVVRYWAQPRPLAATKASRALLDELHEMDYLEQGRRCCGG
jgi:hypothetical protein